VHEPDHRIVETVYANLGKTAGPVVEIHQGDPDVSRRRKSVILVESFVPVPHDAEAKFRDERRAEDVRVVDARALVSGGPGAGKAAVMGAAVDPAVRSIQTGIRNSSGLVAVTHKKTIVDAEHVIDLHVELVDILRLRGSSFKICRRPR